MRILLAALALLLFAAGAPRLAAAQAVPQGSYLSSCFNPGLRGDTLVATCRTPEGRELRSALHGVRRCVGDIGNNRGVLQCTLPSGAQLRAEVIAEPGYRPAPPPPYGAPPPPYGAPPPRYYPAERCRELHRWAEQLRYDRNRTFDPVERARIEERLRWVRNEEADRCRYPY